jgi:hypothetical protein
MSQESPLPPTMNPETTQIAEFLFQSFFFSQGSSTVQENLLVYGQDIYNEDLAKLTPLDSRLVEKHVSERAFRKVTGQNHINFTHMGDAARYDTVESAVHEHWDLLRKPSRLAGSLRLHAADFNLGNDTCSQLIGREHNILKHPGGRPRKSHSTHLVRTDAYLSQLVHFGVLKNPTSHEAFDKIYKTIGEVLLNFISRQPGYVDYDPIKRDLDVFRFEQILAVHLTHHPKTTPQLIENIPEETRKRFLWPPLKLLLK